MAAVKHIVQVLQHKGTNTADGDDAATNEKSTSIPTIPAGRKIEFTVQATCEGVPAEVTVEKFSFDSPFFIDSDGYRINLLGTTAPRYIITLPGPQNPVALFNIGPPESTQTASATATAFLEPCGTFDASGSATFTVARLFYDGLDSFGFTTLKTFTITPNLDFGSGIDTEIPASRSEQQPRPCKRDTSE